MEILLVEKFFYNGSYLFELIVNCFFCVEIKSGGYVGIIYSFWIDVLDIIIYGKLVFFEVGEVEEEELVMVNIEWFINIFLIEENLFVVEEEFKMGEVFLKNDLNVVEEEEGVVYILRGIFFWDNLEYVILVLKYIGIYFKV